MISKKIITLSLLFIPTVFGIANTINALDDISSEDLLSEIVLVETENEYDVYAEALNQGYLQVTVID